LPAAAAAARKRGRQLDGREEEEELGTGRELWRRGSCRTV